MARIYPLKRYTLKTIKCRARPEKIHMIFLQQDSPQSWCHFPAQWQRCLALLIQLLVPHVLYFCPTHVPLQEGKRRRYFPMVLFLHALAALWHVHTLSLLSLVEKNDDNER